MIGSNYRRCLAYKFSVWREQFEKERKGPHYLESTRTRNRVHAGQVRQGKEEPILHEPCSQYCAMFKVGHSQKM